MRLFCWGERWGRCGIGWGESRGGGETPHRKREKKGGCSDGHALEQMNVGSCRLGCVPKVVGKNEWARHDRGQEAKVLGKN